MQRHYSFTPFYANKAQYMLPIHRTAYLIISSESDKSSYQQNSNFETVNALRIGDANYVKSVSGGYTRFGNVVIFSVRFTFKTQISASVTHAIAGLPSCLNAGKFLVSDNTTGDTNTTRMAILAGTTLSIKGAYSPDVEYCISGAYIAQ